MGEQHGKLWWEDAVLPCPVCAHCSPQIPTCSPPQKLSEPHPFGFLWRLHYIRMIKSLAIEDWFNLQPLSHPQGQGVGTESYTPDHMRGSGNQPCGRWDPKATISIAKDVFVSLITEEIPRALWSLCQKGGWRPNMYSLS